MGETTAIAWADHTFNPWMGCSKVSPGCDNCYAEALGKRTGRVQWGDEAERVVTSDGYWRNPLKWDRAASEAGTRRRVFCASMADVFEDRPDLIPVRERLGDLIDSTPHLDWQLLTKRPENVTALAPGRWDREGFPPNVWIGTTVEDQDRADQRLPDLLSIPCAVRFLSCEPLLGHVNLAGDVWQQIDWLIIGGESGPNHRPLNLAHARNLRDQANQYGVPVFFKQVGGHRPTTGGDLLDGVRYKEFPSPHAEPAELHPSCTTCGRWGMDHGRDHAFQPGVEVCAWSSGHATSDGYIPPACPGCPHG